MNVYSRKKISRSKTDVTYKLYNITNQESVQFNAKIPTAPTEY